MIQYSLIILASLIGVILQKTTFNEIEKYYPYILLFKNLTLLSILIFILMNFKFSLVPIILGILLFIISYKISFLRDSIFSSLTVSFNILLVSIYVVIKSSLIKSKEVVLFVLFYLSFGLILMFSNDFGLSSLAFGYVISVICYDYKRESEIWFGRKKSYTKRKWLRSLVKIKANKRKSK